MTSDSSPSSSSAIQDPPTTFPPPIPPTDAHNHRPSQPNALKPDSQPQPSLAEGFKTIRPYDFTGIHLRPCARESLIFGMGSGFAIGGLRFVLGAGQYKAMSWAMGAFCLTSIGAHAICKERRRLEKQAMEAAREIMERKKREKYEEAMRERARRRAQAEEERRKNSWSGWLGLSGGKS